MPEMESEYMTVKEWPTQRKTRLWSVLSKSSGGTLGHVRWYGPWRQYCFYPEPPTVFSGGCLREIAAFIGKAMHEHREKRKGLA